jgi:hypothetical protein
VSKLPGRTLSLKRRRRTRHAAGALLTGLAVFTFFQLGLAAAIEKVVPEVRDPLYGCRLDRIRKQLDAGRVKPFTVIMLGSSRTQSGFKPVAHEKTWGETLGRPVAAFNFGVSGGGPLTQLMNWRRLHRDGVRPDLLLVEVMPPLLSAQVPPGDYAEERLPTDRLGWKDISLLQRYAGPGRAAVRREWLQSWPVPCYSHRISLVSLMLPGLLPMPWRLDGAWKVDDRGRVRFIEADITPDRRLQALRHAHDEYQGYFSDFRLGGPACEALHELLTSCREEGAPVALVLMPEGPTFQSWYPPGAWQSTLDWVNRLGQEFDAPVINAREWIDEEGFMDSHHLLTASADEFTGKLGRECIVPSLQQTVLRSAAIAPKAP